MQKEYSQAIQGGPRIKQVRATLGRCHNDSWMTMTQTRELTTVEDDLDLIFPWLPMILQGLEGSV
jgi:Ni2+-binding GTPase involved in maturation of urease and hydrogenase